MEGRVAEIGTRFGESLKQDLAYIRGEDEDKANLAYETGYVRLRLSRAWP